MNKNLFICTFIITYLSLSYCFSFLTNNADFLKKRIQILDTDTVVVIDNATVSHNWANLKVGGRLIVKIKACRDSGKNWYFKYGTNEDKKYLNPLNLNYFNSGQFLNEIDKNGHLSSEGYYYFLFKPRKIGEYRLYFIRRKPFEFFSKKNKMIEVKLRVRRDFFSEDSCFDGCNFNKHNYFKKHKHNFNRNFCDRNRFSKMRPLKRHRFRKCNHCFH